MLTSRQFSRATLLMHPDGNLRAALNEHTIRYASYAWAEVYLRSKWHLDPSSRLATIDMGKNCVGAVPFFLGGAGSPSNTVACTQAYLHTKWHLSPSSRLATMDMGRKLGALQLLGEGSWVPIQHSMARAVAYQQVSS